MLCVGCRLTDMLWFFRLDLNVLSLLYGWLHYFHNNPRRPLSDTRVSCLSAMVVDNLICPWAALTLRDNILYFIMSYATYYKLLTYLSRSARLQYLHFNALNRRYKWWETYSVYQYVLWSKVWLWPRLHICTSGFIVIITWHYSDVIVYASPSTGHLTVCSKT